MISVKAVNYGYQVSIYVMVLISIYVRCDVVSDEYWYCSTVVDEILITL